MAPILPTITVRDDAMRCVRAKGKEILDIAALLAFPETFGMGGVTVRKLLVRRPLCLCRFRFSLPRP